MKTTTSSESWRELASCKGIDTNIFVPKDRGAGTGRNVYAKARKFCDSCPVKNECLMFALESKMEFGMFGGTTPRERRSIKKFRLSAG